MGNEVLTPLALWPARVPAPRGGSQLCGWKGQHVTGRVESGHGDKDSQDRRSVYVGKNLQDHPIPPRAGSGPFLVVPRVIYPPLVLHLTCTPGDENNLQSWASPQLCPVSQGWALISRKPSCGHDFQQAVISSTGWGVAFCVSHAIKSTKLSFCFHLI